MDLSAISESYELRGIELEPELLLLDPTNPRIILETQERVKYTPKELASPKVQEYILSIINKAEYHVAELIRGIRTSGFLSGPHDMIVERVDGTGRYLVIEGNRRLTAIKHLLTDKEKLDPVVLRTLRKISVKEFIYTGKNSFSKEEVLDVLMGTIHITGPLEWSPIERAYYLYRSYMRRLKNNTGLIEFRYDIDSAREVAVLFNMSIKKLRKELMNFRAYEQLNHHGYNVKPNHYSLIDLAIGNRILSTEYFELNVNTFLLSRTGLEKFAALCIGPKTPINSPKEFRAFSEIYKNGTEHEVHLAESGAEAVTEIYIKMSERHETKRFQMKCNDILFRLEDLVVAEFRGMSSEVETINKIRNLVDTKLYPLTKK